MFKVALIGIISVLLYMQMKQMKSDFGLYITFAAGLLIFVYAYYQLEYIIDTINRIQSLIKVNDTYISILLKMIGIAYVSEFSSAICKDAGCSMIGGQIEMFGKLTILAVSMPVVLSLLELINVFFE